MHAQTYYCSRQRVKKCVFFHQVLGWYRTTGHAQLQRTELGDSYDSAKFVQEDHQRFEQQAKVSFTGDFLYRIQNITSKSRNTQ